IDKGTGQAIRTRFDLRADVAGKTGTTQKNTDGWFILMHPRLVTGSWVGFNDSRVTMRSNYWGEGGHNALLVVGDFFQHILDARLIDSRAEFPYERPYDSIWDPYLDLAKEWLGGIVRDWWLGESAKPAPLPPRPPRRDTEREAPRFEQTQPENDRLQGMRERQREQRDLERERQKERLLERLRDKQEQREQEQRERDRYRDLQEK
ncbi:MAG TPA: hypothetical protein VE616_16485, partial [Candidatus Udaeobacter sp.]|nr:hypothetical protein [Candidatus Udaeobacter sp.]